MSDVNIFIEGNEEFIITKAQIKKCVNKHGNAFLCGYVEKEKVDSIYRRIISNETFIVKARDDKDDLKMAFAGVVVDYKEKHQAQYCELELWITGKTYLMDLIENKRIFQNTNQSYNDIMGEVSKEYGSCFVVNEQNLFSSINHISVQYGETDWNYIKRLASEKAAPLIPYGADGFFSVGVMSNNSSYNIKVTDYQKICDIENTNRRIQNGVDTDIRLEECYVIRTREMLELGDSVNLEGIQASLIVYQIDGVYDDYRLVNTYVLKHRDALKVEYIKNYNIIGASISGTVDDVVGDKVKVLFDLEGNQDSKKLFDFATVYSSQSDAGWYCMPEKSDLVRLYFPNEKEEEAFVFNAMQIQKEGKDPAIKFFRNPQGKLIEFAPEYIKIANGDLMKIELNDKDGIIIKSDLPIKIESDDKITVESTTNTVTIEADTEVSLKRENSSIVIGSDIKMTAAQIHMQDYS